MRFCKTYILVEGSKKVGFVEFNSSVKRPSGLSGTGLQLGGFQTAFPGTLSSPGAPYREEPAGPCRPTAFRLPGFPLADPFTY